MTTSIKPTIPAEPDTTDRPVYRVTMPSGFPWADQKLTIPAPASADDIAMVVHTELTEVGYASGTLDVTVELSTGVVQVSYQGWTSSDGAITGPGVGTTPAEPDTTPDLTAVTTAVRALLAAGWKVDYAYRLLEGNADSFGLIHPSGREITATVYPDRTTTLSLHGLTLDQVVGAVTGAGLAPAADDPTPTPGLLAQTAPDTRVMPNGTERPGEHWNARLIREAAERATTAAPCSRCTTTPARPGTCCSSHEKRLCHLCYRRTHFVEVCVAGCSGCAAENLPVLLSELTAQGGIR